MCSWPVFSGEVVCRSVDGRLRVCHREEITHYIAIAYSCICNRFPSIVSLVRNQMSEGVEDPLWTA